MIPPSFTPKLFSLIKEGISRQQVLSDLSAGIVVGIVALPLAIAFAIASGVPPEQGIVTTIVAGITISLLGGSRVQIGGPTGAFIVIVFSIVQAHGLAGLTTATLMAGIIILVMGLARLGNLLRFIPYPLVVGFTSGIALVIFTTQIKDLLGLPLASMPGGFLENWRVLFSHLSSTNLYALAIGLGTILISSLFGRLRSKVPGSIVAILLFSILVFWLDLPVATIESTFGAITMGMPSPSWPAMDFETIHSLIQPAFAIALLGGIESLLSAVVADGMIGGRHRSNMELVAQGVANILSALFKGIPATGAIARTATNIRSGGRTPIAGIVHGVFVLIVMLFLAPYVKLIPMAALAGVLIVVAYHMSEWRNFASLLKSNRLDVLILLTTFGLTVVFDLIIAIEVGVVLSSFIFMQRMSESVKIMKSAGDDEPDLFEKELADIPKGVVIYEINGALFFGAAQKFQVIVDEMRQPPKVLILRLRNVPFIDATGIHRLQETIRHFQKQRVQVLLSGVSDELLAEISRSALMEHLSPEHIQPDIGSSLNLARKLLDSPH